MKYKSNTSKKSTLPNDLVSDKKESQNPWRAKWVNGTLTYPKDKPLTTTGIDNSMTQYKINDLALDKKEPNNPWRAKWVNGNLIYPKDKPLTKIDKDNIITQHKINAQDSETFSLNIDDRRSELVKQNWNRDKSQELAASEDLTLNDEHWAVINYLRNNYMEQGVPRYARSLARDLEKEFSKQGGNKYLRNLFPGGAVTQGCRLANLRTPANATDISFGTSY